MILVIGEAVTFILILHAALVAQSVALEVASRAENTSRMSLLEFTSFNVMLDCCHRLDVLVVSCQEPTEEQLSAMAEDWEKQVTDYLRDNGMGCSIDFGGITIEPLRDQCVDPLQMGFLGVSGEERFYITGVLSVHLSMGNLEEEDIYPIRIAA